VSEFLVAYLDAIDERLLDYLDEEDELRPRWSSACASTPAPLGGRLRLDSGFHVGTALEAVRRGGRMTPIAEPDR
jgi:hypothetical protein